MTEDLVLERTGAVLTIRLSRERVLNALRLSTFAELRSAYADAALDDSLRVVVLTGTGRAFCAGADLSEMARLLGGPATQVAPDFSNRIAQIQETTRVILHHPKLTVAAINGLAVGYGAELPLACDIRVASSAASMTFPEARRGLCQTNGSFFFLPRLVGLGRAKDLMLTGDTLTAADAERLGLVTRVFDASEFSEQVKAFAARLSQAAPLSVSLVKQAGLLTDQVALDALMALEAQGIAQALASEDLREGVRAYHAARDPQFKGR